MFEDAGAGDHTIAEAQPAGKPDLGISSGEAWLVFAWWSCLTVLAVAAAGLLSVGFWDLVSADGLAARGTGFVLMVVSALTLGAVGMARLRRRPAGRRAGSVAAVAMLVISVWVAGTVTGGRQRHLSYALVVAMFVAVAAVIILVLAWWWRRTAAVAGVDAPLGGQGESESGLRVLGRAEIVGAVATIVAALVALPLTWYSAQYLPAHAAPAVSIKATLGDVTMHAGRAAVTVTISVENTGTTGVRLIGSLYTLSGVSAEPRPTGPGLDADRLAAATRLDYGPGARYSATTALSPPTLIQFGQVTWDQATLVPAESTEATVVAFFPVNSHDILRVGVDIVIARDDRLAIGAPRAAATDPNAMAAATTCDGRLVVLQIWPVEAGSLVEALTGVRREVVLGRVVADESSDGTWWPAVPYLAHQIQRVGLACKHLFEPTGGLEDESMAGLSGAMAERLVPAELAPVRP